MKANQLRNHNISQTFRQHWFWLLLMCNMLIATGCARAIGADMTNSIVTKLKSGDTAFFSFILLVCLVQFVNYFTKFVSAYSCVVLQKKMEISLRVQVLRVLQRVPFLEFEALEPGMTQTILRKDVEGASEYLYVAFSRIGVSVTTLFFTAYFMLRIDALLTCALLAIAIAFGFLNRRVLQKLKKLNLEAKKASGSLSQIITNMLSNRDTVKVYQAESFVKDRFKAEREHLNIAYMKTEKTDGVRVGLYTVVNNIILYGGAILLAGQAIAGKNDLGQVVAYIALVTQALIAIEMIFRWMSRLVKCNAAWERVATILCLTEEEFSETDKVFVPAETLTVENLGFSYTEDKWILRNRSFCVSKGELLEIVGESGSGKSTLFKCLLGLYQPKEGMVKVNNQIVSRSALMEQVGFVPAEYTFYADTIYNNITMGDTSISRETCLYNADRLGIRSWLEELGLDYRLNENANDLSGGQKQILSVLRAVNFDKPILILDEPFASLDMVRRNDLSAFLDTYRKEHIVILTSHIKEDRILGAISYSVC